MSDGLGLALATTFPMVTQRALFAPSQLAGLQVWLDMADLGTITESGGDVSQVDDKSGQANHATQGDGARQPLTGSVMINGLNTLRFQSDQLIVPNNSNDDMDIFIIANITTAGGGGGQWWGNQGLYDSEEAGGQADFGSSVQASGLLGFGFGPGAAGGDSTAKTPGSVLGADHLLNMTRESIAADVRQIRVDGSLVVDTTTGNRRNTRNNIRRTIGSIQTNGNYMADMKVAEILVYDRVLTAAERTQVEDYARAKWGVA
jgi:hypothetical protein